MTPKNFQRLRQNDGTYFISMDPMVLWGSGYSKREAITNMIASLGRLQQAVAVVMADELAETETVN